MEGQLGKITDKLEKITKKMKKLERENKKLTKTIKKLEDNKNAELLYELSSLTLAIHSGQDALKEQLAELKEQSYLIEDEVTSSPSYDTATDVLDAL